jgi:hypothetical protein
LMMIPGIALPISLMSASCLLCCYHSGEVSGFRITAPTVSATAFPKAPTLRSNLWDLIGHMPRP